MIMRERDWEHYINVISTEICNIHVLKTWYTHFNMFPGFKGCFGELFWNVNKWEQTVFCSCFLYFFTYTMTMIYLHMYVQFKKDWPWCQISVWEMQRYVYLVLSFKPPPTVPMISILRALCTSSTRKYKSTLTNHAASCSHKVLNYRG
jgi:hypothetical protein